jgi:hypothetical protein
MDEKGQETGRVALLQGAIARVTAGNKTAFGRLLGYKDGGFVRQMLVGTRPVTEKTVQQIEGLPGMRGWFSGSAPPAPSTSTAAPVSLAKARGRPSLLAALEVLGDALETAPVNTRTEVLKMLELYLGNPRANRAIAPIIVERLSGESPVDQTHVDPGEKAA